MRRVRVSIAGLMALVVFVAVAAAALREASEIWAGVLFVLTLATVGFAVLRASYRTGSVRAFWAGFALFAAGYLAVSFLPGQEARPPLPTAPALTWLQGKLLRQQAAQVLTVDVSGALNGTVLTRVVTTSGSPWSTSGGSSAPPAASPFTFVWMADGQRFQQVGHCLLAVLVGLLGGLIARWQQAGRIVIEAAPAVLPPDAAEEPCPNAAS
jgi:hypothetical protein